MSLVKKSSVVCCLALVFLWGLGRTGRSLTTNPQAPASHVQRPARADLAEAVFSMVTARAEQAGMPRPATLCEACVATHLDLDRTVIKTRCNKFCVTP